MNEPLILVVEDDPVQRRLVRENLEAHGYPVVEASSRKEALEAVLRRPVDVAVVDYKLGDETGIDAIRDMLAANPLVTPIMVTAYGNIERAVEAVRRGPTTTSSSRSTSRGSPRPRAGRGAPAAPEGDLRSPERLEENSAPELRLRASPLMEDVARLVVKAARSEATVLISARPGRARTSWPG
jgi:DNA-binding NtrC family response regulator